MMKASPAPRAAAIHDLSGFGRCALTVVIPVLAAMGIQPVPLPTALLSTHTGGFEDFTFLDLTEQMKRIAAHWSALDIKFDAVYSGFLGSGEQCGIVSDFIARFRRSGSIVLVDPVMGDNGSLYATVTPEIVEGMRQLVKSADIITPNVTEAEILLGEGKTDIAAQLEALCKLGPREVVVTGAHIGNDIVTACLERGGKPYYYARPRVDACYPGTGDLFASVLLGLRLRGEPLGAAAKKASDFVFEAILAAKESGWPPREGVCFEKLLYKLINQQQER